MLCGRSGSKRASSSSSDDGKKRKLQSVLDYPPRQYNLPVFKANNPFVDVFEQSPDGKKVLKGDKVADGKRMNPEGLNHAIRKLIETPAKASASFKEPSTETGGRIVHGSLVLDLWTLTKPSAPPSIIEVADVSELERGNEDDEVTDLIVSSNDDEGRSGTESNESVNIRHEGDDPENVNRDDKTVYDFELLVRNPKVSAGLDNLVTVMIVECSWDSMTKKTLYQGSSYASKAAIENVKKEVYDPVVVEGWGESLWMYGIVFPTGVLTITDGKVSDVQSNQVLDKTSLDKALTASMKRMRTDFKGNSADVYPDGEYLKGTLFISRKKFLLPNLKAAGSGALPDSKLFFQTLLRVVAGDKVLSWTPADVDNAEKERRGAIEKVKDEFLGV